MRLVACLALCSLLVAGCSGSLFESKLPIVTVYVLSPSPSASAGPTNAAVNADIAVGHPIVAPGLDTDRIAVLKGHVLDYYAGASWGATASVVMQSFLIGSIQNQQLFRGVATEDARVASDYLLDIELTHFQAEYPNGEVPSVHVGLVGRVVRVKDRRLVATIPVEATEPAAQNQLSAVVAAFEKASREVAVTLAQKTSAELSGTHQS
jgi:cholesterol transport system auxiliary component